MLTRLKGSTWVGCRNRRKHHQLAYVSTSLQAADILTKPFTSVEKWGKALKLIAVGDVKPIARSLGTGAVPPPTIPSAAASRPLDVGIKRLIVEVCCSSESLFGQIATKEFKDCHVARITEENDLNKSSTRKDVICLAKSCNKHNIPVLVWVSLPCTGGSSWSHVNLTLPGNREKVVEAKKKFVKLWASFVDMSAGLDKVGVQYAIEWPKHCVYWNWSRVKKWIEAHPVQKAHFDGCRFGLINKKGEYVKKPWTIATTIHQLYDKFSGKCCKGGHFHGKCTKESESYTSPFARTVHSTFSASVAEALHSKARRATVAAVATQVPKALPIISHPPVADMAAQRKQVLTADERESRAQAFFEGLTNPDRLADAMAGLTPQAWVNDVIANMEDPLADAAETDLYLGNIPVREWRLVRENAPGLDWLGCYELWHRLYARRHRGDMESDLKDSSTAALAGWPKIVYELIQDMAALGSLTRQGHALDITKEYDLMYRIFMLKDGCGYITIYPETVKILENFFTPALVRLPPPTGVRSQILVAGDSSLALCWFNRKTKKATHKATFEEPLRLALRTEPRCAGLRVLMNWGRGINDIAQSIEQSISGPFPPEGVDIFVQWAGNDVYGSHGYMGYTWHIQHPWVTQTWMDREKAENWPAKQRLLVDSGVRRIITLQSHPAVRSITAVLGPQNGDFYSLPEEYDREMARHAKSVG